MRDDNVSLPVYIKMKIKLLTYSDGKQGFGLKLTDEEIAHFHELKNEIQVDNYAHQLIMDKL